MTNDRRAGRRLVRLAVPLMLITVLLAAACSNDDTENRLAALDTVAGASAGGGLFGVLNPLQLLGAGSVSAATEANPGLAALLLRETDLPPGFVQIRHYSGSASNEFGVSDFEQRTFQNEDPAYFGFGGFVDSLAISIPPDAPDVAWPVVLDDDALAGLVADLEKQGINVMAIAALDATSLPVNAIGIRIEADLGGIQELADIDVDPEILFPRLAVEMYVFEHARTLFGLTVSGLAVLDQAIDALTRAQIMATRAGA